MRRLLVIAAVLLLALVLPGAAPSTETLVEKLKDRSSNVRVQAAVLLGRSGDRSVVGALTEVLLGDESEAARAAAAGALGVLSANDGRQALLEASARDPAPPVREAAKRALVLLLETRGKQELALDALGGKVSGALGVGFHQALGVELERVGFALLRSNRTDRALRAELRDRAKNAYAIKPAILLLRADEQGAATVFSVKVSGVAVAPDGRVITMSEASARMRVGAVGLSASERSEYETRVLAAVAKNLAAELRERL